MSGGGGVLRRLIFTHVEAHTVTRAWTSSVVIASSCNSSVQGGLSCAIVC